MDLVSTLLAIESSPYSVLSNHATLALITQIYWKNVRKAPPQRSSAVRLAQRTKLSITPSPIKKKERNISQTPAFDLKNLSMAQIYNKTGLFPDLVAKLFRLVETSITAPRNKQAFFFRKRCKLSPLIRMIMVLEYLRRAPASSVLAETYGISAKSVERDLHFITPILMRTMTDMNVISWPEAFQVGFEGAVGAIDCTSHERCRVHPGQVYFLFLFFLFMI